MNLHVRAATPHDTGAIDDLLNAYAMVHQGRVLDPGAAHDRLTQPGSEPAVVEDSAGSLVGFGHAWRAGAAIRCYAVVRPGSSGKGVGTALLSYLEERARTLGPKIFNVMQQETDTAGPGLLRSRGYTEITHILQMQIRLPGYEAPNAPLPPGVDLVGFDRDRDSDQLFAAFRAAFPDDPDDAAEWWHERCDGPGMRYDPALWFVARRGGEVVGFCLGARRDWKGDRDCYVSDVGVRPAERGRGIAFALLTRAFTVFAADGSPTATLNVDVENLSGALRLYVKAGMRPSPQSTEWSRPLPG